MGNSDSTVNGTFYAKDNRPCRRVLYLRMNEKISTPYLLVIMMNPGAFHPHGTKDYAEITKDCCKKTFQLFLYKTQFKIMYFMTANSLRNACIINLS